MPGSPAATKPALGQTWLLGVDQKWPACGQTIARDPKQSVAAPPQDGRRQQRGTKLWRARCSAGRKRRMQIKPVTRYRRTGCHQEVSRGLEHAGMFHVPHF